MRQPIPGRAFRRSTIALALIAATVGLGAPGAMGQGPAITQFWKPWFVNLGGSTPGSGAPFLELSGKLKAGTTLHFQCWGLDHPGNVLLIGGAVLDLLPGPGGAVLVPHPSLVLSVEARDYDDDGPAGPLPGYSVMELAVPFGAAMPPGPGACFQIWAKQGQSWMASNAVAASFTVAAAAGS